MPTTHHLEAHRRRAAEERRITELFSLAGKCAVVLGGTGRVGQMAARGLSEAGAAVLIAGRDVEKAQAVANAIDPMSAVGIQLDIRSEESLAAVAAEAVKKWGKLDILIHAVVDRTCHSLRNTSLDQWDASMTVNARGLFMASRVFGELMQRQHSGSILNIASVIADVAPDFKPNGVGHTTSIDYPFIKGGMIAMTRYLAALWGPDGVRVNTLSPGGVFSGAQDEAFLGRYSERVPLGRLASADDIKACVVFLVSDASAYVTGQNVVLDGGLSLR